MIKRLTEKQIQYAIRECSNKKATATIAQQLGVTQRRIQQLFKEFQDTGYVHIPQQTGRKPSPLSSNDVDLVLEQHKRTPVGVMTLAKKLRANHVTSYNKIWDW